MFEETARNELGISGKGVDISPSIFSRLVSHSQTQVRKVPMAALNCQYSIPQESFADSVAETVQSNSGRSVRKGGLGLLACSVTVGYITKAEDHLGFRMSSQRPQLHDTATGVPETTAEMLSCHPALGVAIVQSPGSAFL